MQRVFQEFLQLLEPHRTRWATLELRVLAYNGPAGLQNLLAHAICRFQDTISFGNERIAISKRLTAITARRSFNTFADFLTELAQGRFLVAMDPVSLAGDREYYFSVRRLRAGEMYRDEIVSLPAFLLEGGGPSFSHLLGNAGMNDVVWELRSASSPYESTEDFWGNFLDLPARTWGRGFGDTAQVIVTAPLGVWLASDSQVSGGQVEAHVRAVKGAPTAPVRVGLIARGGGQVLLRNEIGLGGSDWVSGGDGVAAKVSWAVPGVTRASLIVSVGEEVLVTQQLTDHTTSPVHPRLALHGQLDLDLAAVSRSLQGEGRDPAGDFELGVALLLHLSGFATMHYGRGAITTSDAPDIVAFHPSRPVVVIGECTLRDIDSQSKLSKLYERSRRFKEMLGDHVVVPIVFTVLPRDRIADADLEKAAKSGIYVASRADIDRLLGQIAEGTSPDRVMEELASLEQGDR